MFIITKDLPEKLRKKYSEKSVHNAKSFAIENGFAWDIIHHKLGGKLIEFSSPTMKFTATLYDDPQDAVKASAQNKTINETIEKTFNKPSTQAFETLKKTQKEPVLSVTVESKTTKKAEPVKRETLTPTEKALKGVCYDI